MYWGVLGDTSIKHPKDVFGDMSVKYLNVF